MIPNDDTIEKMENLLGVASDFTRLKIMYAISKEEKCVADIQQEVGASQSLVSHQLRVLKEACLVSIRKEGTKVFYFLNDDHVLKLLDVVNKHVLEEQDD